jgi:hypothetical protein
VSSWIRHAVIGKPKEQTVPTVEQAIAALTTHSRELQAVTLQLQAEVDRRKGKP